MGINRSFNTLRTIALIVTASGAACSLYYVMNAGKNNSSLLLQSLFIVWVLSPFVMFFIVISKKLQFAGQRFFYWMMIIMTILALISYSGLIKIPRTKNAFVFLVMPFLLWIALVVAFIAARRSSDKINN